MHQRTVLIERRPRRKSVWWRAYLCFCLTLAAAAPVMVHQSLARAGESSRAGQRPRDVPGARALEERLIAPCCWVQTLDIHESPVADELRLEIRRRLSAGETATTIEDDFARRYGERIRAVPRGKDPRNGVALGVFAAMLASLATLVWLGIRWLRVSKQQTPLPAEGTLSREDSGLDAQIDEELQRLSESE